MVVDTSAIVAAMLREPDADRYGDALEAAPEAWISAVTWYEARIVIYGKLGVSGWRDLDQLGVSVPLNVFAFDDDQVTLAFDAYRRFGKGSGHPARLNLVDCASYALARSLGMPLLYKGEDFARTDVESALA